MGRGTGTMVIRNIVCLAALGTASVLTVWPSPVEACGRSEFLGHVKSVVVTESLVDSGKIGRAREVLRVDVSHGGNVEETTQFAPARSAERSTRITAEFKGGRLTRQLEVTNGKTVSTMTCSYDAQGRLTESNTQADNAELSNVETYEYSPGFIRRRTRVFSQWKLVTQTLDATGRIVREVVLDEANATVEQTTEFRYDGDRTEQCSVSSRDPRRHCGTKVQDSHGNEIEFVAEGQTRRTSYEYDSVGNWISRRSSVTGPRETTVETIVQRKIEYW